MDLEEKIEALKENGFEYSRSDLELLIKKLNQGNDRFETHLYVYTDEIDVVYINCYLMRGLETISEQRVMEDHNSLNTNTKNDYIATMGKLPFLKSRL